MGGRQPQSQCHPAYRIHILPARGRRSFRARNKKERSPRQSGWKRAAGKNRTRSQEESSSQPRSSHRLAPFLQAGFFLSRSADCPYSISMPSSWATLCLRLSTVLGRSKRAGRRSSMALTWRVSSSERSIRRMRICWVAISCL